SVKWLRQIVVARERFTGFYQTRRYYEARQTGSSVEQGPLHAMRVKSQIARPLRGEVLRGGPIRIQGAAWSGEAQIARVELSFDGGGTWVTARLAAESAPNAWRLWSYDWNPARDGRYEIMVRARDTSGAEQPLERDPRIVTPYANNWVERRVVEISR